MIRRLKRQLRRHISPAQKAYLKAQLSQITKLPACLFLTKFYFKHKRNIINKFFSYDSLQLENQLRRIGLVEGDTVFTHSSFAAYNGFKDGPQKVIDCILNVIGNSGNLLMVSMGYHGISSYEYLRSGEKFDVLKTMSQMGIITEIFRRKKGVVRSLSPTNPVLAFGPDAAWLVADHHRIMYPCGKGSPFDKILKLNAKALFFDTPIYSMTFYHYLEDRFKESLSVQLYREFPVESIVVDAEGNELKVKTYIFNDAAVQRRSIRNLEKVLRKNNVIRFNRIGNTTLRLVNLSDVVDCVQKMVEAGQRLY
jgi:aminoglycoside 3-N-acetyltransferase